MFNFDFFFLGKVWEQLFHHILQMIFQERCFSCYILLTDQNSMPGCFYFLTDIGDKGCNCTAIVNFPDCDVINFEINLIFLIKPSL